MSRIQGDDKSVKSLLGQKFRIDYYQREYKWRSKQVRELIEDLTSRFLLDYLPTHERKTVSQYGQYFLGSVIISNKDGDRFIVDGQQRLTSLTLLLIYLDGLQKNRPDQQRVEITNLVYSTQFGSKSFNLDVQERNACLQALISGENPDPAEQPPSVQNLINRYNEITDIFPEDLRGDALPYFLDWLTEKVMLVEITAFSDDDAYTIFETMNDRGLSLTPTDMLKGYLLANITDDDNRAQASDSWKNQMAKLLDLGKDEDADCVKAWLRSQYADKIRERRAGAKPEDFDKLGTEFHRWVRENKSRVELSSSIKFTSFVTEDFCFYARAYSRARRAAETYTDGLTSVFFNAQNSFTLQYPLMLAPLRQEDDKNTVTRKMCLVAIFIEIMLARRIWNFKAIDHSTMQYRAFLVMKAIRRLDVDALAAELIRRLSPEGAGRDEYIDFETQEAFRLHGNNGPQVHRLLARLTEFAEVHSGQEPRYPEYAKRSAKKGGYQIEHIWADHPERFEDEFGHSADFAEYRNRIGGLVLLPGPDNASYSDMTFEEKVKHYAKQNLLAQSLHPIAYENKPGFRRFRDETGLPFSAKSSFKKADLDERQELYIALANRCWSVDRLKEV
ncbi:MAG: DUF262 domain-containing protein [Gammaproteobacteria bacterium]|nr:DUF262 domain-containing protein [Gammaproteobacteria bacterium]MDE0509553.1 DUF262 domain-containing protein [Gammaproteobacteria bacterium]